MHSNIWKATSSFTYLVSCTLSFSSRWFLTRYPVRKVLALDIWFLCSLVFLLAYIQMTTPCSVILHATNFSGCSEYVWYVSGIQNVFMSISVQQKLILVAKYFVQVRYPKLYMIRCQKRGELIKSVHYFMLFLQSY